MPGENRRYRKTELRLGQVRQDLSSKPKGDLLHQGLSPDEFEILWRGIEESQDDNPGN